MIQYIMITPPISNYGEKNNTKFGKWTELKANLKQENDNLLAIKRMWQKIISFHKLKHF